MAESKKKKKKSTKKKATKKTKKKTTTKKVTKKTTKKAKSKKSSKKKTWKKKPSSEPKPPKKDPLPRFRMFGDTLIPEDDFPNIPTNQKESKMDDSRMTVVFVVLVVLAIVVAMFAGCSIQCVDPGHVGVLVEFGEVDTDVVLSEGFNTKAPWKDVVEISAQARNESVGASWRDDQAAVTSDTQSVGFKLDIGWFVDSTLAPQLVRHIGRDQDLWGQALIEPCMWQAVKNVVPRYSVVEITQADSRREASDLIEEELKELINERLRNKDAGLEGAITVTQVNLSNIDYSEVYEEAIESKQLAEQQVLREQRELERIRIEAQQQVAQAEAERDANIRRAEGEREARRIRAAGEADAIRIRALAEAEAYLRIRQTGVDPMANRFYDGWNGEFPRVFAGGGGEEGLGVIFPASVAEGEISPEDIGILIQNFQRERQALEQRISDEGTVIPDTENASDESGGANTEPATDAPDEDTSADE